MINTKTSYLSKQVAYLILLTFFLLYNACYGDDIILDNTVKTVLRHIENDYINPVNSQNLTESAINGMLKDLDPYCRYLNPQKFLHWRYQSLGESAGIGVEVLIEDKGLRIVTIYDNTPASQADLRVGDFITKIDHSIMTAKEKLDVSAHLLGPADSLITLEIRRQHKIFTVTLQRSLIQIPTLTWYTEQNIGYIHINIFDSRTEGALNNALRQIKEQLGDMQGLVLDLRNNGGGSLEAAIQVSDVFLDGGDIVTVKGKGNTFIESYQARPGDILQGLPLVVLINNASASASEIVAGALQGRNRAQVVGTTSYGKGMGQKLIPLENGAAIFLTVEQYYTPKGQKINDAGIRPDFIVSDQLRIVKERNENATVVHQADYQTICNEKSILKNGEHFETVPDSLEHDYPLRRAVDIVKTYYFLKNQQIADQNVDDKRS